MATLSSRAGRVESGGNFEDAGLAEQLRAALPAPWRAFLRPKMEWYGCRGAFFHNDAHYDGVLFGVWCIQGPPREIVFPRIAVRVSASPGALAVFDPFEPHAVLDPGAATYRAADYEAADVSLFLGFEVELSAPVCAAFGIGAAHPGATTWSSRLAINPISGAPATSGA